MQSFKGTYVCNYDGQQNFVSFIDAHAKTMSELHIKFQSLASNNVGRVAETQTVLSCN